MKHVNQTNHESYERMNVMNKMKTRIGVVSMATLAMSGSVAGSAIAAISKSFPDTPISTIQLLSTLPGVGSLIITLVAGQMAMRVSKKSLVLLGVALVTLGGLVPAFWNSSVAGLLACSVILGMGVGFISTLNPMILTQYFEGEERSSMMGFNTGMTSLGTMILTGVGGFLGGSNWRHLYWVFAFGIVVFLLVLFCLPKDEVIRESFNGSHEKVEKESTWQIFKGLNPYVYWVYLAVFILGIAYTAYMANLSIVVAAKHMGGTATTGLINAIGTFGGIFAQVRPQVHETGNSCSRLYVPDHHAGSHIFLQQRCRSFNCSCFFCRNHGHRNVNFDFHVVDALRSKSGADCNVNICIHQFTEFCDCAEAHQLDSCSCRRTVICLCGNSFSDCRCCTSCHRI